MNIISTVQIIAIILILYLIYWIYNWVQERLKNCPTGDALCYITGSATDFSTVLNFIP